jgi:toxin ParE1/3/4
MAKRLVWTEQSQKDLNEILEYIAFHDSVEKAISLFDNVTIKADKIVEFPSKGRVVPELKRIGVWSFFEQIQTPYRIIYKQYPKHIAIVGFLDGRRDLGEMLIERAGRGIG